ncbi:MAG: TerB family tellurite resistance protein [Zoogloeaceae bacterium]|nr:TerB family tellurite resistance protein [Rhodocyclaceae bacterium]MCP5234780.1 TerB family tellurite resistance protein [Zoogloeaceae bacterium]
MRSYPPDSPKALARLVAMAVVADGEMDNCEIDRLRELDVFSMLGVESEGFYQVLLELCRDLAVSGSGSHVSLLSSERLEQLAADVTDPKLRKLVLSAMLVTAKADGEVSVGEQTLLRFLIDRWSISLDSLRQP